MRNMKGITNTARDERMPETLYGANPRAIEAQEERGQAELVSSNTLPVEIHGSVDSLIAAGVVFGAEVPGDPLFRYVTLPPGWEKRRTDHSMWSTLVDAEGREWAAIFYKAAFYDRRAFLRVTEPPDA